MAIVNITSEAKRYILSVVLRGTQPAMQLWIGLSRKPSGEIDSRSLMVGEPSSGYARQPVFPNDWTARDESLETREVMFENAGPDPWPEMQLAFLATGRAMDALVLSWAELDPPRVVLPGDRLAVGMRVGF